MPRPASRPESSLAAQFGDPRLGLLYAHWNDIRGDRLLPIRQSLDPVQIPSVLSSIFLCDYEANTGRLRYSLVGEDIRSRYAEEIIGSYQDRLFEGAAREAHLQRTRIVMETPAIYYARGDVYGFAGRHGTGERLALPLSSDGERPDSLIGATIFRWETGVAFGETEERMTFSFWSLDGLTRLAVDEASAGMVDGIA